MPANWYIPSSATATLVVGLAKAEIADFRVTPAAEVGDIIGPTSEPVAIGVRNTGDMDGIINLRIRDRDGSTIWTGTITLNINGFGWVYPALNYPMPARDLRLRAEAYHGSTVDSFLDKTVLLILKIVTATTLTLDPPSVDPGGIYHYKGQLTNVETGAGIGSMDIIARREGSEVGSGITDANGNYDIVATAPTTTGSFLCQAVFQGVDPFAASSAQARLGVGVISLEPIAAVASAVLGLALVILSLKFRGG